MPSRALEARLGPYPYPTFKVVQSAGGYGMESPGLDLDPDRRGAANLRYLATHETAHQWFYGLVGNDQAQRAVRRRGRRRLRRALRPRDAARQPLRDGAGSTGRSTTYSSACYYETIYIQGGNLLDDARARMGSTAFWAALRGYVARPPRTGSSRRRTLLDALDDGDAAGPRRDAVRAAVPAALLSGRGPVGARPDAPVRGERLRHLAERRREERPPGPPARDEPGRRRAARGAPHGSPYAVADRGGSRPMAGHSVQA